MPLVPQIFVGSQFQVDALRLEDHADFASQFARLFRRVKSLDHSPAATRYHQSRKNAEHRGLAAAIRSEKPKQFGVTYLE